MTHSIVKENFRALVSLGKYPTDDFCARNILIHSNSYPCQIFTEEHQAFYYQFTEEIVSLAIADIVILASPICLKGLA